ncbi:MAG: DUF4249 domain-containing protein [Muribaculaceae bacterium]|nr:DUF4249 domain-containing protein [Muribaculaceae bacterium]
MNKLTRHIFIVLAILSLQSCKKDLDIKYKDIEPITVIEGQLTLQGANVRITMTTPMDEPMDTTLLTDATVTLTDLTDGTSETLMPDRIGVFTGSTAGIPSHEYELKVIRDGKSYAARCEMASPTDLLSLEFNWIKMPYDQVAVLQVTFTENVSVDGDCYWVRLYRNGKAYMWNIITDLYATNGIINDVIMTSRRDLDEEDEEDALRDGDVVTVSVSPISREMYDYLEAVSSDSNGPALFAGDFCLGYFLASPTVTASITFHPDEIKDY